MTGRNTQRPIACAECDSAASSILAEVYKTYSGVSLRFETSNYWDTLRWTYQRSLADVMSLTRAACPLILQDSEQAAACATKLYDSEQAAACATTLHDSEQAEACVNPGGAHAPKVLEIGAFTGILSTALARAGCEVTAADLPLFMQDDALRKHFEREKIKTLECSLSSLPIPCSCEQFDILVCCEVIEHLNFNVIPVFREFARVLKPGGFLYIATPNLGNIATRLKLLRGKSVHNPVEHLIWQLDPTCAFSIGLHWREYTSGELHELLELCGITTVQQYYCHYNDRRKSPLLRRFLVTGMYALFPSFLPGQVCIGMKPVKIRGSS